MRNLCFAFLLVLKTTTAAAATTTRESRKKSFLCSFFKDFPHSLFMHESRNKKGKISSGTTKTRKFFYFLFSVRRAAPGIIKDCRDFCERQAQENQCEGRLLLFPSSSTRRFPFQSPIRAARVQEKIINPVCIGMNGMMNS